MNSSSDQFHGRIPPQQSQSRQQKGWVAGSGDKFTDSNLQSVDKNSLRQKKFDNASHQSRAPHRESYPNHSKTATDYNRPTHSTKEATSTSTTNPYKPIDSPLSQSVSSLRVKQFWPPSPAGPGQSGRLILARYANRFDDLQLPQHWISNLKDKLGVEIPTDTQMNLFRGFFAGQDVFIRCGTGTGKTLATLLAVLTFLNRVGDRVQSPAVLFVLPTIPLAKQVHDWACAITGLQPGTPELQQLVQLAIPPVESDEPAEQSDRLSTVPKMIIGVPSQLAFNPQGANLFSLLEWTNLRVLVLDEADRLINIPGNATQLEYSRWLRSPGKTVRWLEHMFSTFWLNNRPLLVASSATLGQGARAFLGRMSGAFEQDGSSCSITSNEQVEMIDEVPVTVRHRCVLLEHAAGPAENPAVFMHQITEQIERLVEEQESLSPSGKALGLLFMSEQAGKQTVKECLEARGLRVQYIQEAYFQPKSVNNAIDLYLTSYSEGYGLDIPNLQYVIILGKPANLNAYIHMSGRVGRLSSKGRQLNNSFTVITLVADNAELDQLVAMLSNTNITLEHDTSKDVLNQLQ